MSESESETEREKQLITLEQAKTGRSTCRNTGEKIEKGEWRVGIEAWRGGRQSMTWQKAEPFLRDCLLEQCSKANSGTCKKTGHKFEKEETRFIYATGNTRSFLTIPAVKELIGPVVDIVENFEATDFKGLDEIPETDKQDFLKEFGVSEKGRKSVRKSPRGKPSEEEEEKPAKKQKATPKGKTAPKEEAKKSSPKSGKKVKQGKDVTLVKKEGDAEMIGDPIEEKGKIEDENKKEDLEVKPEDGQKVEENSEEEILEDGEEAGNESMEEGDPETIPQSQGSPMNKFEKQRLARIAANMERMRKMGIMDDAEKVMPKNQQKPRTKPKGVSAKKKKVEFTGPRRTSARVQGLQADGNMIQHEGPGGKIAYKKIDDQYKLDHKSSSVWAVTEPEVPKERHPKEPIDFSPEGEDHDVYSTFLDVIKNVKFTGSKSEKGKTKLHNLKMKEEDLAKVTANGISHVQWLPSASNMIVAAADKSGNLGIWNVNHKNASEGDDGVYLFSPHNSYISGMRWNSDENSLPCLYSCSYDGSVRSLDLTAEKFQLTISSEEAEFSSMDCTANGKIILTGDNDGDLSIFDIREHNGEQRGKGIEIHNKRINTVHIEPGNEQEVLTASSDNATSIWDLRKLNDGGKAKPLATHVHSRTVQSAYFAPDGSKRLVTLSRDNTIKIWKAEGSSLQQQVSINHNNNTGRWVIPFRATWSPSSDAIIVGSMNRQVDIYDAKGSVLGHLDSPYMTAIASRSNAHPFHNALAACTNSGRIHIYR